MALFRELPFDESYRFLKLLYALQGLWRQLNGWLSGDLGNPECGGVAPVGYDWR